MDKKGLIALILCGLIMLYFFNTMQPPSQHPDEEGAEKVAEETIEEEIPIGVEGQKIEKVKKVKKTVQEDIELQNYILIQNDVMKSVWTNEGAALKSVILSEFRNPERTQTLELLKPSRTDSLPLSMKLTEEGRYQLKTRRYKVVESEIGRAHV